MYIEIYKFGLHKNLEVKYNYCIKVLARKDATLKSE